jgi:hypothetical protein
MITSLLSWIEALSLQCASSDGRNGLSANLGCFDPRWTSSAASGCSGSKHNGEINDFIFTRLRAGVKTGVHTGELNLHSARQHSSLVMTDANNGMTRRNVLIGAAATLISAPAIVRAAGLMPVRGLPLQSLGPQPRKIPQTMGEWYQLCFYHNLEQDLRAGRAWTFGPASGRGLTLTEAQHMVARARAQGWLTPSRGNG